MEGRCLYTTCFNRTIFDLTGKECIRSFLEMNVEGDLLLAYEAESREPSLDALEFRKEIMAYLESLPDELWKEKRSIALHDLDNNEILNEVLENNKDVIPTDYGGENAEMSRGNVPENLVVTLGAARYFKYRASKWWRVFAALHAASCQEDHEYVIQIDADLAFIKPIPLSKILEEIGNHAVFYHEGKYRRERVEEGLKGIGIETSFTGYSRKNGGYNIIERLMQKLTTQDFRNYDRWDDSFLLSKIIHEDVEYECRDLIDDDIEDTDVVGRGPFKDYIRHFKGLNGGSTEGIQEHEDYMREKNA